MTNLLFVSNRKMNAVFSVFFFRRTIGWVETLCGPRFLRLLNTVRKSDRPCWMLLKTHHWNYLLLRKANGYDTENVITTLLVQKILSLKILVGFFSSDREVQFLDTFLIFGQNLQTVFIFGHFFVLILNCLKFFACNVTLLSFKSTIQILKRGATNLKIKKKFGLLS